VGPRLNLANQVRDTINTLAAFNPAAGSGGLAAQIEELERTVPEAPDAVAGGVGNRSLCL